MATPPPLSSTVLPLPTKPPPIEPLPTAKVSPSMNNEMRQKSQSQLLAHIIFPTFVPPKCHPKVDGLMSLLKNTRCLFHDTSSTAARNPTTSMKDDCINDDSLFTLEDWTNLLSSSSPSPFLRVQEINEKCDVYRQRADEYKRQYSASQQKRDLASKAMIYTLNYSYCLAQTTCPSRMNTLISCWNDVGPYGMKELLNNGGADTATLVCSKERTGVERCCGQPVQSALRSCF